MIDFDQELLKFFASEVYQLSSKAIITNFNNTNIIIKDHQNGDLVTDVDLQIEKEVRLLIQKYFPQHKFWSEESGGEMDDGYVWILDPLDGTNNYAIGLPLSGTILTLLYKNEAVFAFISYPFVNKWYYAIKGMGVYANGVSYEISVSENTRKLSGLIGYEVAKNPLKYSIWLDLRNKIQLFSNRVFETWSPVIDFYLLFERKIDTIIIYENEFFDVVGGILIAKELGLNFFTLNGNTPLKNDNIHKYISGIITVHNSNESDIVRVINVIKNL